MKGKDLLSICDLTAGDIRRYIESATDLKTHGWVSLLQNKTLALLFEKPSLRTRVSFELAMRQLGGQVIYLSPAEIGLGKRESVSDIARVLCRYIDVIAARTFSHHTLEVLARCSEVPVINALSDYEHPCQALADLLTVYEHKGDLAGLTVAYIGDGNNVANSLLLAASLAGMNFHIASPPGYTIQDNVLRIASSFALESGAEILNTTEPAAAVCDADVIYTDVWTSMGQEAEAEERRAKFAGYQVTAELVALAKEDAILMHPLPAHHGEEVAEGLLETPQSVIFDQAENRLHMQKALLADMLGGLDIMLPNYR